jgi:hypothetical protein
MDPAFKEQAVDWGGVKTLDTMASVQLLPSACEQSYNPQL